MDVLWASRRPLTTRDVLELLDEDHKRAYTTVMTVLDNLHRKGYVSRRRDGRAFAYRPVRSREEHTAALMEQLLTVGGDPAATLLHFVEHLEEEEATQLRAMLDRLGEGES